MPWCVSVAALVALAAPTPAAPKDAGPCHLGDEAACTAACDAADQRACVMLGTMYLQGIGVERNTVKGDALFVAWCKKGDGDACNAHGVHLREKVLEGKLGWESTFAFFERACTANSAKGCNNAAAAIIDGHVANRAPADGVALYRKSCEIEGDGSAAGCFGYGDALHTGAHGVAKDDVLAAKWLAQACRFGQHEACDVAAELGERVVVAPEAAARLEQARCDNGDVRACAHLGATLFARGSTDALKSLRIACIGEDVESCATIGNARMFGKGNLGIDVDEAVAALDKACGLDEGVSCRRLGDQTIVGHTVPRDVERAVMLYKKACRLGDEVGCHHSSSVALAKSIKRAGDGIAETVLVKDCKDGDNDACLTLKGVSKPAAAADPGLHLAADDTERACEAGTGRACFDAAARYERKGKGFNPGQARYFYELGCKAGFPRACAAFGDYLDSGKGGARDTSWALDAWSRGCSLGNADACEALALRATKMTADERARSRPLVVVACNAKLAAACDALKKLE